MMMIIITIQRCFAHRDVYRSTLQSDQWMINAKSALHYFPVFNLLRCTARLIKNDNVKSIQHQTMNAIYRQRHFRSFHLNATYFG